MVTTDLLCGLDLVLMEGGLLLVAGIKIFVYGMLKLGKFAFFMKRAIVSLGLVDFHQIPTTWAVGNGDGYLRIWNVTSGELHHKLSIVQNKRRDWIRGIEFTNDSNSIFFSSGNGCAKVYSLAKKQTIQQYLVKGLYPDEMQEVQISPNGLSFGFRIQSGQMTVYNSHTNEKWQVEQTLQRDRKLRDSAFGIMRFFDQEGKNAVSYDNEGILRIWRFED